MLRQPIYEKDRMDPVTPGAAPALDRALLESFPGGYRHLAYLQNRIGYVVKKDMPGLREPDVRGTVRPWSRLARRRAALKRYAHIAALRGDGVLPELLDMSKIVSEDTVRRAFAAIEEEAGANWMRGHLDHCVEPLLSEPWILDVDTTVKPLYGHQEGAVVGYNPKKPGRGGRGSWQRFLMATVCPANIDSIAVPSTSRFLGAFGLV